MNDGSGWALNPECFYLNLPWYICGKYAKPGAPVAAPHGNFIFLIWKSIRKEKQKSIDASLKVGENEITVKGNHMHFLKNITKSIDIASALGHADFHSALRPHKKEPSALLPS